MATPHISAEPGDFADTVLLPGDPLRAQYIAENFLDDATLVTSVRNILGYTGTYKGERVSVMGTGMGVPSASIYGTELINEYEVKKLIRIGSCGAMSYDLELRDVVIAMGACTDSNVNRARYGGYDFAAIADYELLRAAVDSAKAHGKKVHVGNIYTADLFYHPDNEDRIALNQRMGVLAVEMEAAGLYGLAAEYGARALALMTVSDHVLTHEATSAEDRQTTFNEMVEIALETARAVD
ncbi:MAG: purine-nucleoside phosphorylase [Acidimicrobiia bacterium]|nr:purine-nucleoside phosphorylase [Acidimicrobiia bacterium]